MIHLNETARVRPQMAASLDSADRELLLLLQQNGGATIQDVCAAEGITATAVRHRLGRLHLQGFVDRESVRSGRGRPHHVYRLTEEGFRQLGENYGELAKVLWDAIREIDDPAVRQLILGRVRRSMVSRYGRGLAAGTLSARFASLAQTLGSHGFDVEVDNTGDLPILRENSCPYHELASEDGAICELEQSVFEEVLGTSVTRSQCCLEGDTCCEFTPVPENANG